MPELFLGPGRTTPLASLVDQWTELYAWVDDFLATPPNRMNGRQSAHDRPRFADADVLRLARLPGGLGVASRKQTYGLVAAHYRSAFPRLCSDQPGIARLPALTGRLGALRQATTQQLRRHAAFYLIDAKPIAVCHPVRPRRVRLLREEGAWWAKPARAGSVVSNGRSCLTGTDGW